MRFRTRPRRAGVLLALALVLVSCTDEPVAGPIATPDPARSAAPSPTAQPAAPRGRGRVLRDLDFQTRRLVGRDGKPTQWENYVPEGTRTSGVSLGSPGTLPFPYLQAARFKPVDPQGRPRSMVKLAKHSEPDPGVRLRGPLDAAEGLDRYYQWYTYFPKDFDLPESPIDAPSVFMAWHNDSSQGSGCNTNVQMHVKRRGPGEEGMRILVRLQGGRHSKTPPKSFDAEGGNEISCYTESFKEPDLGPIVRGRWIRWQMRVRWSSKPGKGLVEITRDGKRFRFPGANLYTLDGGGSEMGFMELGYYSPVDTSEAARRRFIWHTGFLLGDGPRVLRRPPGCRRLRLRSRPVTLGGDLSIGLSRRARSRQPAVLSVSGTPGRSVSVGGRRYPLRGGRARIPVARLGDVGRHRVSLAFRDGSRSSFTVSSRPCAPLR